MRATTPLFFPLIVRNSCTGTGPRIPPNSVGKQLHWFFSISSDWRCWQTGQVSGSRPATRRGSSVPNTAVSMTHSSMNRYWNPFGRSRCAYVEANGTAGAPATVTHSCG